MPFPPHDQHRLPPDTQALGPVVVALKDLATEVRKLRLAVALTGLVEHSDWLANKDGYRSRLEELVRDVDLDSP